MQNGGNQRPTTADLASEILGVLGRALGTSSVSEKRDTQDWEREEGRNFVLVAYNEKDVPLFVETVTEGMGRRDVNNVGRRLAFFSRERMVDHYRTVDLISPQLTEQIGGIMQMLFGGALPLQQSQEDEEQQGGRGQERGDRRNVDGSVDRRQFDNGQGEVTDPESDMRLKENRDRAGLKGSWNEGLHEDDGDDTRGIGEVTDPESDMRLKENRDRAGLRSGRNEAAGEERTEEKGRGRGRGR